MVARTMGIGLCTTKEMSTTLMNCNCGDSTVFCSLNHRHHDVTDNLGLTTGGNKNSARCRITSRTNLAHATAGKKRNTVHLVNTGHDAERLGPVKQQQGTQREEQPAKPVQHMPLPESTASAKKTVILVHTDHDAEQLRPANIRREHRKPARRMPLSLWMTSGHTSEEVSFSYYFSFSSSSQWKKRTRAEQQPQHRPWHGSAQSDSCTIRAARSSSSSLTASDCWRRKLTVRPSTPSSPLRRWPASVGTGAATQPTVTALLTSLPPPPAAPAPSGRRAAALSSLSSVPVGQRAYKTLHHGCDAGQRAPPRRCRSYRSIERSRRSSATRRNSRHQPPWIDSKGQNKKPVRTVNELQLGKYHGPHTSLDHGKTASAPRKRRHDDFLSELQLWEHEGLLHDGT